MRLEKSFMICYNSASWEGELSVKLGVPLYAAAPDLQIWGTKSGSGKSLPKAEYHIPDGSEKVWNSADLAENTVICGNVNRHYNG